MRFVAFAGAARTEISRLDYNLWIRPNLETNPITLKSPLHRSFVDNK